MENTSRTEPKKGVGPLAWLGLGCGGIVLAVAAGAFTFWLKFGGKLRELSSEAVKNPARAAALSVVTLGDGKFELIAEDDEAKRYTVREVATGKKITVYYSLKTGTTETVEGDFSAIPQVDSPVGAVEPEPRPSSRPE